MPNFLKKIIIITSLVFFLYPTPSYANWLDDAFSLLDHSILSVNMWTGLFPDNSAETIELADQYISQITAQRDALAQEITRIETSGTPEERADLPDMRAKLDRMNQSLINAQTVRENVGSQQAHTALDDIRNSQKECKLSTSFSLDACIANAIDIIFILISFLLKTVLLLSDTLFNTVIKLTIVEFRDLVDGTKIIETSWKIVRDVANIFFIFILLYLAISTALQTPGVDTRKVLVNIIIIALVINFSAVFTRVVIDASNITALTFYNLLGKEGETPDLSSYFRVGLAKFTNIQHNQNIQTNNNATLSSIGSYTLSSIIKNIGTTILLVITIFTLLAASFLLLIRGISLILLIVISPLAFLGSSFKPLSEIFNRWLERLKCDVLFAPLFFFLLYLTFGIFDNVYGENATYTLNPQNLGEQLFLFFILNGLMLGSIMIAQKVGCQMGGKAFNFVTNRSKQSLGAMSGFAGRNSLGFLASKAQKSQTLKNLAKKAPRTGWAASTVAQKVAGYGFGSGFGSDKKDAGLGYTQRTEQRQKRQAEQLKLLKNPADRAEYLSNIQRKALTFRGKTLLSASNEDAKKQYGDLPDRDKAELRINAIDTGNTEMIEVLESLQDTLKGEKKESADKEYEKQLRQYLKVATKDFTDKSGKEVKKGDQLTMAQQLEMFDKLGEVFVKNGASDEAKEKQKQKGKELQQISYNTMSDADKVAFTKEAEKNTNTVDTKNRLDTINEFEKEYIKGRGETEQKFYDEKEKIDKRMKKQELAEFKREAKNNIEEIFKNQNKATYQLTESNLQTLKASLDKLSSNDVAHLDKNILKNKQVIEQFNEQDIPKIFANTEEIDRGTLREISDEILSNPKINDRVKSALDPNSKKQKQAANQPNIVTPDQPYREPRSKTRYDSTGKAINDEDDYTEPTKEL